MTRQVTIDPITRLEGHGKIDIFLDEQGNVRRAYLRVPELRGFEKFVQGRPAEDMPQITSRICGVCPTAHHVASAKALDALYQVEPPPAARKIRELVYNTFLFEDHALHFYFLGGPDFLVGPDAPKAQRNILGVVEKMGRELGTRVIAIRRAARELISLVGGKAIHPVFGLPGGVAKPLRPEDRVRFIEVADQAVEFALATLGTFHQTVLANPKYVDVITSDPYTHRTYYMGLVDERNRLSFYDGELRVVAPGGREFLKFPARDYLKHVAEHVEPWSYVKFCYLKDVGWKGFEEGPQSGVYAVGPLARLNAADGMPTPKAQEAYEQFYEVLGGKPVHHTLATHGARLVEMLAAAETMRTLARDPDLIRPEVRTIPTAAPLEGIGVVEAPRGTLIHHYQTDSRGLITAANLVVATQNNAARIAMSVDKAAKGVIRNGQVDDGLLNRIEMALRAYDPCHGCATHALSGQQSLAVRVYDASRRLVREIRRSPAPTGRS
jgi:F420-non-reducing hydrogenase large subunit